MPRTAATTSTRTNPTDRDAAVADAHPGRGAPRLAPTVAPASSRGRRRSHDPPLGHGPVGAVAEAVVPDHALAQVAEHEHRDERTVGRSRSSSGRDLRSRSVLVAADRRRAPRPASGPAFGLAASRRPPTTGSPTSTSAASERHRVLRGRRAWRRCRRRRAPVARTPVERRRRRTATPSTSCERDELRRRRARRAGPDVPGRRPAREPVWPSARAAASRTTRASRAAWSRRSRRARATSSAFVEAPLVLEPHDAGHGRAAAVRASCTVSVTCPRRRRARRPGPQLCRRAGCVAANVADRLSSTLEAGCSRSRSSSFSARIAVRRVPRRCRSGSGACRPWAGRARVAHHDADREREEDRDERDEVEAEVDHDVGVAQRCG